MEGSSEWFAVGLVMLAVSGYCAARLVITLVTRIPTDARIDLTHAVMGVAMAGMFAPALLLVPLPALAWELVFSAGTLSFAVPLISAGCRRRAGNGGGFRWLSSLPFNAGHGDHVVANGAMIFMVARMPPLGHSSMASMRGMGVSGSGGGAVLASLVGLVLVGYLVMSGGCAAGRAARMARALSARGTAVRRGGWFMAPVGPLGCEAAMTLAMAYMLFQVV